MVEHTLAGRNDQLRERAIGTAVFGRGPDFEPSEDPVVRVRAADVRKRLAQYYQSRTDSTVRIDIPPGSYKAVFQWKADQAIVPVSPEQGGWKFRWWWVLVAVLIIAAISVSAVVTRRLRSTPSPSPSAMDEFWAPALNNPKPILVYNATTPIFRSPDLTSSAHNLIPVLNQYMTIGDAYASVVLTSLFARRGKLYQMRYGADLTFGDLRYQPSILIGAFGNAWTLQTTNDLRFVFDKHPTIRDRSDNRLYTLPNMTPDGRTPEDYAIVSRVFDSNTGELLIVAAGITQYGSRAAGEFLTSPNLLAALAVNAPVDWPKKNLQVLLHAKIVGETPGRPTIVATYFW
ncbi:MAG: hypothetical protein ABSF98_11540 [Bryobacteraceae bacterium]|jgi:hypothetical protein